MTDTKSKGIKERVARIPAKSFWAVLIIAMIIFAGVSISRSGETTDSQRAKSINQQLRCLECEGLSIYDSDTKTSKSIAKDVTRRVKEGESNKTIFAYYENIYGEYIRLAPTSESGNWLIYVVPAFFIAIFFAAIFLSVSNRSTSRTRMMFWAAAGLIFIIGIGVFVNDSRSSQNKDSSQDQKKDTKTSEQTEEEQANREKLLQEAADESPTNENLRSLAILQFAKNPPDLVNALKNFDKAAALDETDAESRGYAAFIVFYAQQYEQAQARADAAVAANDQDVTARFFRGAINFQIPETDPVQKQANIDSANRDFDVVLARAPDSEFASEIAQIRSASK